MDKVKTLRHRFWSLSLMVCISAMAVMPAQAQLPLFVSDLDTAQAKQAKIPAGALQQLAHGLFEPLKGRLQGPMMVADFVDIRHLSALPISAEYGAIGQQVAASLTNAARHYNVAMVATDLSQTRLVSDHQQVMLTRDPKLLSSVGADYVLTGTLNALPDGLLVNARIINTNNQQIINAESVFVAYQQPQKMSKRHGYFFR